MPSKSVSEALAEIVGVLAVFGIGLCLGASDKSDTTSVIAVKLDPAALQALKEEPVTNDMAKALLEGFKTAANETATTGKGAVIEIKMPPRPTPSLQTKTLPFPEVSKK